MSNSSRVSWLEFNFRLSTSHAIFAILLVERSSAETLLAKSTVFNLFPPDRELLNWRWVSIDCEHPLLRSGQRINRVYIAFRPSIWRMEDMSAAKIDHPISYSRSIKAITLFVYFPLRLPITTVESVKAAFALSHEKKITCDYQPGEKLPHQLDSLFDLSSLKINRKQQIAAIYGHGQTEKGFFVGHYNT